MQNIGKQNQEFSSEEMEKCAKEGKKSEGGEFSRNSEKNKGRMKKGTSCFWVYISEKIH